MAFPTDVSRRRALQMAAAGLILGPVSGAGFAAAQGVEAVGQPMPRGVSLPATPPAAPDADSVGIAIIGLGGYALRQMMPAISRTRSCHVAGLVSGNREKALEVGRAYGVPERGSSLGDTYIRTYPPQGLGFYSQPRYYS